MKIKINLFKKIFLFSIFLIIFTVSLSYILSTFAADSFYISRKKNEIVQIKDKVKNFYNDEYILEEYVDNIKDKEGIDISIKERKEFTKPHHRRQRQRDKIDKMEEGFHIISIQNNIMLLVYKENLSSDKTLFITTSLSVMSSHRHEVYLLNLITMVIAMIISIFISRKFAKKITDNISSLNRVAQKITKLDFSEKSEIDSSDELKDLSRSINIMSNSISTSIENLNSFVSNASHELKTPITVIDTHAQRLINGNIEDENERRNYYKVILKESRNMNSLVNDLLLISKLSSIDLNLQKEKFKFLEILKESIEKFEFLELQKDIEWKINLENIELYGNKKLIKIVIDNLVQNALKYSPENSEIKIYDKEDKIFIENPIYLKEINETEKLFEPFYRGNNATELNIDGSGLGLSLIKKILDIHFVKYGIKIEKNMFIFYFDIFR